MKKTYINPTMNIVKLNANSNILAGSDKVSFSTNGESGSGELIDAGATGSGLGRGGIFDEDEE